MSISAKVNTVIVNRDIPRPHSFDLYLRELCRAHIHVVNRLIRAYRLQSYDYFAYEISPWDVPYWSVRGANGGCNCCIVRYKEWDGRPVQVFVDKPPEQRDYISQTQMHTGLDELISPGELDLMDSLNLMERGDYAGAIRRVTSAVEVILEERLREVISSRKGHEAAFKFLKRTRSNFLGRAER